MTRFTFLALTLAMGGMIAVTPSVLTQSASPTPTAQQQAPRPMAGRAQGMAMPDAQMMGMHQKMMADMKAMDATLDGLITKMNAAKGTAKVDAIAEALTTMVQQHKAMRDGMMQMQGQMMQMHDPATMPMGNGVK